MVNPATNITQLFCFLWLTTRISESPWGGGWEQTSRPTESPLYFTRVWFSVSDANTPLLLVNHAIVPLWCILLKLHRTDSFLLDETRLTASTDLLQAHTPHPSIHCAVGGQNQLRFSNAKSHLSLLNQSEQSAGSGLVVGLLYKNKYIFKTLKKKKKKHFKKCFKKRQSAQPAGCVMPTAMTT